MGLAAHPRLRGLFTPLLPIALMASAPACSTDASLGSRFAADGGDGGAADAGADACMPRTEVCDDGLDNDCDGTEDEPACQPSSVSWGEYAAGLPVPDCPAGPELLVDTVEDTLDEGVTILADPADAGPTLSFREALFIASNRDGPDTIRFDADVFPPDRPGVIQMLCGAPTGTIPQVCIDGRDRGVIVRWPDITDGSACPGYLSVREGSLIVGLTVQHMPLSMTALDSQVAGCRLNTDGVEPMPGSAFFDVDAGGAGMTLGPGNVLVGSWGISVSDDRTANIHGNYFGLDPLTGVAPGIRAAIEMGDFGFGPAFATVTDNVFAVTEGAQLIWDPTSLAETTIRDNFVGVDRGGNPIPGQWEGVGRLERGTHVVGPNNIIRGTNTGVEIAGPGAGFEDPFLSVQVTRNSIFDTAQGIVIYDPTFAGAPMPPVLTAATTSEVRGTCDTPGTVEVFSDAADQGETFLGDTACDTTTEWALTATVPPARNVTATLTDTMGRSSTFSAPFAVP